MIKIEKSICHCGKCGKEFDVKWDVDYVSSYERSMGEEYEYEGEDTFYCPNCDNEIQGKLSIYEYPVGCFNYEQITDVEDSFDTKQSYFKEPMVAFFDLQGGKMKVRIDNWGPIEHCEYDLDKDMIVVYGDNNI